MSMPSAVSLAGVQQRQHASVDEHLVADENALTRRVRVP